MTCIPIPIHAGMGEEEATSVDRRLISKMKQVVQVGEDALHLIIERPHRFVAARPSGERVVHVLEVMVADEHMTFVIVFSQFLMRHKLPQREQFVEVDDGFGLCHLTGVWVQIVTKKHVIIGHDDLV